MNSTETPRPAGSDFEMKFLDSKQFATARYAREWLIEHILVAGQPGVMGGPKKTMKTSLAIDMAICLGSGKPFLGVFRAPRRLRAAVLSGESDEATIHETALRICHARKVDLGNCDVLWSFRLPRLHRYEECKALNRSLREHGIKVAFIDPLYLCLLAGASGKSASNLYEMGPLLHQAGRACLGAGATPIFIHHAVKSASNKEGSLSLDDLAFAGIGEYARQWLLVSRRAAYAEGSGKHKLFLSVGGSAGHSGAWHVDIHEGVLNESFGGRYWRVRVSPPIYDEDGDIPIA